MGTYFKITPETAWGSTIYIHSHARSLKDSDNKTQCNIAIKELQNEIHRSASSVSQNLSSTVNYFQLKTEEIKKAGYPTTAEGRPNGMTERFKEFRKELMSAYDILTAKTNKVERNKIKGRAKEEDVKFLLEKLVADETNEKITEYLNAKENGIGLLVGQRLIQMLGNKKYQKKGEKLLNIKKQMTQEEWKKEIANLTTENVVKLLRKNKNNEFSDNTKNDLQKAVKEKEILEKVEVFKKLVESSKEFITKHGEVLSKDEEVTRIIKDLMSSNQSNLIKSGYLLEPIIAYMGNEVDNQGRGVIKWNEDSNGTITATMQVLGRKTNTAPSLGDKLTTDIKMMLDTMNEAIGISVKLNPRYFRKYENLTASDMEALLPSYAMNETLSSQIMYYLSNYAFLTQMYYPKNDNEYRENYKLKSDVDEPIKGSAVTWTDSFGDIQNSLATLLFVKGVIGSFFLHSNNVNNIDNFYKELQEQGVPLIIQTSVDQYWTVDLLRAIQKLAADGNAISAFNKWSYGAMEDLQNKAKKLTENFRLVFKDKVEHWSEFPVTPDYSGDRYAEIMEWKNTERDMKKIESELWGSGSNSSRLMKFFAGKTKLIRYSYTDMMNMIKETK